MDAADAEADGFSDAIDADADGVGNIGWCRLDVAAAELGLFSICSSMSSEPEPSEVKKGAPGDAVAEWLSNGGWWCTDSAAAELGRCCSRDCSALDSDMRSLGMDDSLAQSIFPSHETVATKL